MGQKALQRHEIFTGGENLSFEPERLRPVELKEAKNVDISDDGLPEEAPGYELFLTIPARRQLATMEDTFDGSGETWTGTAALDPALGAADTPTHRRYGFFARKHEHGGAGSLAGLYVRAMPFLDDFAGGDSLKLFVFVTTRANLSDFKVRLEKDAANYFEMDLDASIPGADNTGTNLSWLRSAMTQTGVLTWAEVAQVRIMSTATGATLISFNDLFIEAATATDPVTGIHSFRIPGDSKKYLMVATSDMVYSEENGVLTKRDCKLGFKQMVHFETANDMAIWVNANDNPRRWDPDEVSARDVGVPVPALGTPAFGGAEVVDAAGNVADGQYSAKVTFDMDEHGEGNPSAQSASFTVSGPENAIDYSNIPIGPPGTTRRLIYRSNVDTPEGPWFLDQTVADNTTTTARSLKADSTLGEELKNDGQKPPVLSYIGLGGGKLYGVPKTLPSFVRHSDASFAANRTIEQWDPLNELRADPNDGDVLVGLKPHREYVYPVKMKSLFYIDPRANAIGKISNVYGAVSQRSIVDTGQLLRMWSPTFGPIDLIGREVREIGRRTRDKDGLYPGVEDVSQNITRPPTTGNPLDYIFDTQADWEQSGVVDTDVNTTEIPGSFIPDPDGNYSRLVNLALRRPVTKDQFDDLEVVGTMSRVTDGNNNTGVLVNALGGGIGTIHLDISLATTKKINRIEVRMRNAADAPVVSVVSSMQFVVGVGTPSTVVETHADFAVGGTITRVATFTPRDANKVKITITKGVDIPTRIDVLEIRVFEQGYKPSSAWESPKVDLGATPYEFLKVDGTVVSVVPADIQIYMKSASSAVGLDTAPYSPIALGAPPDPAEVPANRHVRFKVFLFSNGREAPRVDRLSLSFNFANTAVVAPVFESCGIYFEGRYWFNYVPRNQVTPFGMWKIGRFGEAIEHDDYQMSCWTIHDGVLYSGSAVEGKVFRNARNLQNVRITSKEGRPIQAVLETPRSDLGEQMVTKSVRSFIVAARNEGQNFPNMLVNGGLEDWTSIPIGPAIAGLQASVTPTGWDVVPGPGTKNGVNLTREQNRLYVNTGLFSARMDGTKSSVNTTPVFLRQFVNLDNSTPYEIKFWMKNTGNSGLLRVMAADSRVLDFTNGTWIVGNSPLSLTDVGNSWTEVTLPFITPSDITSALPVRIQFEYPALGTLAGITWFDDISLVQAESRVRSLIVLPILDGVPLYPERVIDLVNARRTGVVEERFRIDRAGVRNLGYRVRQSDADGGFKLFGILTEFETEDLRKEERF